ncbi:MAG: hypothetical protein IKO53_01440 [Lachnospiraceae bacterium]|nr:hypothetical protein [Lachnospiraceae bacterium]
MRKVILDSVKICSALKQAGLRQKDPLERTGQSLTTVVAVSNGRICKFENAEKIAEALGVRVLQELLVLRQYAEAEK